MAFVDPPEPDVPYPVRITYADRWQGVARNLAVALNEAAMIAEQQGEHARARRYRDAFTKQCEAHGVVA